MWDPVLAEGVNQDATIMEEAQVWGDGVGVGGPGSQLGTEKLFLCRITADRVISPSFSAILESGF